MQLQNTLSIITPPELLQQQQKQQLFSMELFYHIVALQCVLVLSCTFFCLATCGPCLMNGMQKLEEYDAFVSCGDDYGMNFDDIGIADTSSDYHVGASLTRINVENACANSHSFCFPSTLPGFLSREHTLREVASEGGGSQGDGRRTVGLNQGIRWTDNKSWSTDYGVFELLDGRTVSCSLNSRQGVDELSSVQTNSADKTEVSFCRGPLQPPQSTSFGLNKNSDITESNSLDVSPLPHVEISPPLLDWGQRHLYSPSVAFLTVANTCNDSILHIYEPFSTDIQFYLCNFSEVLLGPGEVSSICFVFLPRWLGLSSAHLVLQTSSGGFLVQVKGYAIESPYEIDPFITPDVPPSGHLSKNLSLKNPSGETLYVKEISALISVSLGNTFRHTEATCTLQNFQGSDEPSNSRVKDWLVVKSSQFGFPLMAIRPRENWEIGPHSSDNIIEIEFSFESKGKIVGVVCMQLLKSSQDESDAVMIPLEVDLDGKVTRDTIAGSLSVSLETMVPLDASHASVIAISLRNEASHMLSVVNFHEVAALKSFQIKYIDGLLLFPGTATQVALITCTQLLLELHDSPPQVSKIDKNCKLDILTNDSTSPHIEIPCQDIIHACLRHQKDSSIWHGRPLENSEPDNRRTNSVDRSVQFPSEIMALETAEADEFVLGNWKSQGTTSGMSVLDDHEVLFPMAQVGTHLAKWITVKNPSEHPVVMQLILNSGEIIDECRDTEGFMEPPSSGSFVHTQFTTPTRHGFSMADGALTEAYVHPYGKASFGPIFFHPSSRCGWRSSALIRNNLSGVEWLSLRGFGGSVSLLLLEGSKPVQNIEFNLTLPVTLNVSPLDMLFQAEETTRACSLPLSKELYAKNMGDLPLEVKSIDVSGTDCGLDGFMVHTCGSFSLEPGESTKLRISYQTDLSAIMVHRDLELAVAGGILVIPIKATLPLYMFNLCKRSVLLTRLKKAAVILAVFFMFLIFCCIFPQVIAFGTQDYLIKGEEINTTTAKSAGKLSRVHRNQKSAKFSMSNGIDSLPKSVGEDKTLKQESVGKYSAVQDGAIEQESAILSSTPTLNRHEQANNFLDPQKDAVVPSLLSKSAAVENSDMLDASQPCSLTVRTGKEKGRRRRRRKGINGGLTGPFEVSSSQSGNSTPSSPLSPVTSVTYNRTWSPSSDLDPTDARSPFVQAPGQKRGKVQVTEASPRTVATEPNGSLKNCSKNYISAYQEQPSGPSKRTTPVSLSSTCFHSAGSATPTLQYSSPLASSTVAPHARAPGPKPYSQNAPKVEEKVGNEYTYDIWGNHFSPLHLMSSSKDVTTLKTKTIESDSSSFFVRGPQALLTQSHLKPIFEKDASDTRSSCSMESKLVYVEGRRSQTKFSCKLLDGPFSTFAPSSMSMSNNHIFTTMNGSSVV